MALFNDVSGVARGTQSWLEQQWTQRLVQVSVFAAIIFWFLSSYKLIGQVDAMFSKTFNLKLGQDGTRAFHGIIFGLLMYFLIRFIMDPLVKRLANGRLVEGASTDESATAPATAPAVAP